VNYNYLQKLLYNYKKLSGNNIGFFKNFMYSGAFNAASINMHSNQLTLPDYHKVMFNRTGEMQYHISGYGQSQEETFSRVLGETVERFAFMSLYHLYSDKLVFETYNNLLNKNEDVLPLDYVNTLKDNHLRFKHIQPDDKTYWLKLYNYITNKDVYYPFAVIGSGNKTEVQNYTAMSTGTAVHISYEQALSNAITEALQLHNFMSAWYLKEKLPVLDWEPYVSDSFRKIYKETFGACKDFRLIVLDNSINDKIFSYITIIKNTKGDFPFCTVGIQGGVNSEYTLLRSMLEAAAICLYMQFIYIYQYETFHKLTLEKVMADCNLDDNVFYWANYNETERKEQVLNDLISSEKTQLRTNGSIDAKEELMILLKHIKGSLKYFSALEITPPEVFRYGYKAVRVLTPELVPMCFPAAPYVNHKYFKAKGGIKNGDFPHPLP